MHEYNSLEKDKAKNSRLNYWQQKSVTTHVTLYVSMPAFSKTHKHVSYKDSSIE